MRVIASINGVDYAVAEETITIERGKNNVFAIQMHRAGEYIAGDVTIEGQDVVRRPQFRYNN